MDWSSQPELVGIYLEEVDERSRQLLAGAKALSEGTLPVADYPDYARDAHTLKGSSRIMGLDGVGRLAAAMEKVWAALGAIEPDARKDRAAALGRAASIFRAAVDDERAGDLSRIEQVADDLEALIDPPKPAPTEPPASPPPLKPEQMLIVPSSNGDAPLPTQFGGLLASLESLLIGTATRVDSAVLYQLINRCVEVALDIEALSARLEETPNIPVEHRQSLQGIGTAVEDLQRLATALAAAPLHDATETFPQFARYLARRLDKEIKLELSGEDLEVDRQVVDVLREPLRHLLVNAINHGIERPADRTAMGKPPVGTVSLTAAMADGRLLISVADDGSGIDWEAVARAAASRGLSVETSDLSSHLFAAGFTTVSQQTDFSGDGEGLAAVGAAVELINGGVSIESRPSEGTVVTLSLPASLALRSVLLVRAGGQIWGIPEPAVLAVMPVGGAEFRPGDKRMELWYQGRPVPVAALASTLGIKEPEPLAWVVVLATTAGAMAVTVPKVLRRRRVAVKSLGPIISGAPHLSGAALLGGGEVAVVLEPNHIGDLVHRLPEPVPGRPHVLVVDDSASVRQLVTAALMGKGFEVTNAGSTAEAKRVLEKDEFAALVVDYEMPGSDGVELVRHMREIRNPLPIVMVSSVADTDDQARAWEAGVDAYLDKSDVRHGVLAFTLRTLLEMRGVITLDEVGT